MSCPFAKGQPPAALDNAIETAIRNELVNFKVNATPMAVRLAWHASGTYDKSDNSGGSDGATMRFEPESKDDANAGLNIMRDLLCPIKKQFPFLSHADIWARAGAFAIKQAGGPNIDFRYGRTDASDNSGCPAHGRLPDAAQGAQHLRDVFYRMGFDDREIVALSGAHTMGSCHKSRSGFDGPWTNNPLKFDNEYFKLLVEVEWKPRKWDGPVQYEDPTGKLMMLPTDIALTSDAKFREHVERYAADEATFFREFSVAFAKLLSGGCRAHAVPACAGGDIANAASGPDLSHAFREFAMHGSLERMQEIGDAADANSTEEHTQRTALHKAAFWGHAHVIKYLIADHKVNVNVQDLSGSTALHDASQFGHAECIGLLQDAGADASIKDNSGRTASDVAVFYGKADGPSDAKRTRNEDGGADKVAD
jgi:hypothetical protein